MSAPGGWNVVEMNTVTSPAGQPVDWSMSLQGNGLASSGLVQIRLATSDGFKIDWNTTIEVLSTASPRLIFDQVYLPDGSSSSGILGAGPHPVGDPGFDLHWMVWNEGSEYGGRLQICHQIKDGHQLLITVLIVPRRIRYHRVPSGDSRR